MQVFCRIKKDCIWSFFSVLVVSVFIITSCVTQSQGDAMKKDISELDYSLNRLREKVNAQLNQTERNTKTALSSQSELQSLQRQLGENAGDIDALKLRLKKIEETTSATIDQYLAQIQQNEKTLTKLERQVANLELAMGNLTESSNGKSAIKKTPTSNTSSPSNSSSPAAAKQKLPLGAKTSAELLKIFTKDYEKGLFKELAEKTTTVIQHAQSTADMRALALEFRGEAKFNLKDYRGAALDLANYVEQNPQADRGARAFLLLGDSYVYLKKQDIARSYYRDCVQLFPNTSESQACLARAEKIGG